MEKIQIKDLIGNIIFEFECKNNDWRKTIEEAKKRKVNLNYADLRWMDLRNADMCGMDLRNADMCGMDLRNAVMRGADLCGAKLSGANLCGADLCGAKLSGTYLYGAKLRCANLREADLSYADLSSAAMSYADLREVNLCNADLYAVDLRGANLYRADLCNAKLRRADLRRADLRRAENVPNIPMACPSEGSFIAWKKVDSTLVKLEIPSDAKRSSATTKECRCDKAKVLRITDLNGGNPKEEVVNYNYTKTLYKVGEMVFPDSFDEDRWNECSNGIHFFIDKQDAIDY